MQIPITSFLKSLYEFSCHVLMMPMQFPMAVNIVIRNVNWIVRVRTFTKRFQSILHRSLYWFQFRKDRYFSIKKQKEPPILIKMTVPFMIICYHIALISLNPLQISSFCLPLAWFSERLCVWVVSGARLEPNGQASTV